MIRYLFREGEPIRIKAAGKANPQVLGEALAEVNDKAGGKLEPKAVVDAARNKLSPLHPHFEWNDALAAESHRLEQARNLIRIIRIEDDEVEEGSSPAYVSINADDGVAYRPLDTVKKSADLQASLMKQADRDLEAFQRRYRVLKEICTQIAVVRAKLRPAAAKKETRIAA